MPLLIGEAPGAEEVAQGAPFVGKAGQYLWLILEGLNISRDDVSLTNILKCQPPGNDFDLAGARGTKACFPAFSFDLNRARPPFIITLGARATKALIRPLKKMAISQLRGHSFVSFLPELQGIPIHPTYHPSYLNYAKSDEDILDAMIQDFARAFGKTLALHKRVPFILTDKGSSPRPRTLVLDTESVLDEPDQVRCTGYASLEGKISITASKPPLPTERLICHFARHDFTTLRRLGSIPQDWDGEIEDTILLCQMLDENRDDYSLKSFAAEFGYDFYWREVHGAWEKKEEPPVEILHPYCATDVALTRDLYLARRKELTKHPAIERNYNFLTKQIRLLSEVELNGIAIRSDAGKALRSFRGRIQKREAWIRNTHQFERGTNVNGRLLKLDLLFNRLKLPIEKRTTKRRDPKLDKEVLRKLAQVNPTARRYAQLSALMAQEKDLKKLAQASGALLHPRFNLGGRGQKNVNEQAGPVTGRLSSQEPNMQNVPEWARVYVVSRFKDGKILKVDAKQIEIKAAYQYSRDPALIAGDVHQETADLMTSLGLLLEVPTKAKLKRRVFSRQEGKTGNFAVIYHADEPRLMDEFKIPYDAARELRYALREHFHIHFAFLEDLIRKGKQTGQVESLTGHVRRLPLVKYGDKHATNQLVNFPIQNLANHLNLCAAAHFGPWPKGALLVNLVHDENVYDCVSEDAAQSLAEKIEAYWKKKLASDVRKYFGFELAAEFSVEIGIGSNWAETEEIPA